MNYTTVEQLLVDEGFLAWYRASNEEQLRIWDAWIQENEENRKMAMEAVRMLNMLYFKETLGASDKRADEIWKRIEKEIEHRSPALKRRKKESSPLLLNSYMKVAVRNLRRGKMHSVINIVGLSVGMAVSLLIGFWIWDELSFNKFHEHYDRIAQVMERGVTQNGTKYANYATSIPVAQALRDEYGENFDHVVLMSNGQHTLGNGDNKFTTYGSFMEPEGPEMLSLRMQKGSRAGLKDPASVLLSESMAQKLFKDKDPIGNMVKMDNNSNIVLKVTGVYKDLPRNDDWQGVNFIVPWQEFLDKWDWIRGAKDNWNENICRLVVQLAPNTTLDEAAQKIRYVKQKHETEKGSKLDLFLHPMSKWHLYSEFKDGYSSGGLITFVWLFGTIGAFVLLLACINFMNLSTARSEKRAREVGIRKVMGSMRRQLIFQFFTESVLTAACSFLLAIVLTQLALPWFNGLADKDIPMPWGNAIFWGAGLTFTLITGIIAGSYPALFLSNFRPVKVLKGTFRMGKSASMPRKVLVIFQFAISVLLINGTIIVFKEIKYAKDRPVGYQRSGLVSIQETTPEIYTNYNVIRAELLSSGAASDVSESQCPVTDIWTGDCSFTWSGIKPSDNSCFAIVPVRHEFGKTVRWQILQGRDFSKAYATDSSAVIINESAVKSKGFLHPLGMTINEGNKQFHVIGEIKDMIQTSPFETIPAVMYSILHEGGNFLNLRLNPTLSAGISIKKVAEVMKKYNPGAPFEPVFADQDYERKFGDQERFGDLALVFAILAIFISALGLFGLASFVAEQRTKEIGIRKVLGASLLNIWKLISNEFVLLIGISLAIATPTAWFFMHHWLQNYEYRTDIPWWIFAGAGMGAIILTLITVSYQSIKAALINPVKSLRTE